MIIEKFILNVDNQLKFLLKTFFWLGNSYTETKKHQTSKISHRFGQKVLMFKISSCLKLLDIHNFNMVVKSVFSKNSEILKVFINKKP